MAEEAVGAASGSLKQLEAELRLAQENLEETARRESEIKTEVEALGAQAMTVMTDCLVTTMTMKKMTKLK